MPSEALQQQPSHELAPVAAAPGPQLQPLDAPAPGPAGHGLKGVSKAAVLLVSLGSERAAGIFNHLREDEIERLSLEMAQLDSVPSQQTEKIYHEVIETAQAAGFYSEGGVEFAREVLEASVGAERAAEIIGRLAAIIEMRPFEFLRRTPPDQIATFLQTESPQTIALVIANLHTTLAAQVLSQLPSEQQAHTAIRIATMHETSPEVIKDVEAVLRQKLSSVISQEYAAAGGVKPLADILNSADRSTERNVLDKLNELDGDLAEQVRTLLFVFDDIVKIDDRGVQQVMKDVDQKDLALALRGVSDEVKDKILRNMSQRGAEMLIEELEIQPPQRRSVVEEAQGRIVAVIRKLEEAGALTIMRGSGEDDDEQLV
ncbi:MAG: flagellar motor switch protein FliG [Thermoleophilales bacterium]|jgi:flagellar motor switch protein FliG|nr:flagellar motor switch protein FliG [Thermoleophilales bacterium]